MESEYKLEGFCLTYCHQTTSLSLSLSYSEKWVNSSLAHNLPIRPVTEYVDITAMESIDFGLVC